MAKSLIRLSSTGRADIKGEKRVSRLDALRRGGAGGGAGRERSTDRIVGKVEAKKGLEGLVALMQGGCQGPVDKLLKFKGRLLRRLASS